MTVNKFVKQTAVGVTATIILVAFLFLAAVFASHPAFSQTSNTATKESRCISTLQHQANIAERIKGRTDITVRMRVLRNGAARRFMAAFNALPPESSIEADTVGIVVVAGVDRVWITLATNRCIQGEFQMPVKVFLAVMDKSGNRQGDA